ncbi:ornithine cyclodeaminase family protein [Desulfotruncus alcoholivorax]|uniref:ornithine cyclodeaminase family protein n=1 Tax=Desulfotruncus alcoholivorax TaxID=265477 RepID=UPI0004145940|nr:hypothetical protein [Desulfotruncus alcoholivorax]
MLILSAADVYKSVTMLEAIDAVATAYQEYSSHEAVVPLRVPINVPEHKGISLFMPGYSPRNEAVGVKIVSVYPENVKNGLPTIHALVVMLDGTTGKPVAAMEGGHLTALRTGAASGVATRYLARADANTVAVIGTGVQARTQLLAVCSVRNVKQVLVYDVNPEMAALYASEMQVQLNNLLGKEVAVTVAVSSRAAVADADIIVTATTSQKPVISGSCLKKGVHINGVGSFTPQMQEIDEDTVLLARKVVADSKEAVLAEAGDLIIPINKGLLKPDTIVEIGDIVSGKKPGRENDDEITFFKTVGMALLDVVVGNLVYRKAVEKGLGCNVSL